MTTRGVFTTLHSFSWADGANPTGPVIQAADGNLYGTTTQSGTYNNGTIFRITPGGVFTTLYSFSATSGSPPYTNSDGASPISLVQAGDGNLYGMTRFGGGGGDGTLFKITTDGALTTLHVFIGIDGTNPYGGLIQAADGSL